jgi:hypothetical protein
MCSPVIAMSMMTVMCFNLELTPWSILRLFIAVE